jgi:uncharacterized protein YecT (DUF1311 family)
MRKGAASEREPGVRGLLVLAGAWLLLLGAPPLQAAGAIRHPRETQTPRDLDDCDHARGNDAWCLQARRARLAPEWERRIAELRRGLEPAARQALTRLRRSADALIDGDSSVVADESRGGTASGLAALIETISGHEAFVSTLETFGRKRAPKASPEAFQKADQKLNEIYREQQAGAQPCDPCVPAREILRDAQRAWIRYRDAWTAFYRLRWRGAAPPEVLDREIRTALTRQRNEYLTRER